MNFKLKHEFVLERFMPNGNLSDENLISSAHVMCTITTAFPTQIKRLKNINTCRQRAFEPTKVTFRPSSSIVLINHSSFLSDILHWSVQSTVHHQTVVFNSSVKLKYWQSDNNHIFWYVTSCYAVCWTAISRSTSIAFMPAWIVCLIRS